jgi:hypothetical protein
MKPSFILALVALSGLVARKKDDPAAGTAPTTAAASSAPAAPKAGCAPGLTKVAAAGFCIKLPAGYTLETAEGTPPEDIVADFSKNGSKFDGLTVKATTNETPESWARTLKSYSGPDYNVLSSGDLPGGTGRFFLSQKKKEKDKDWWAYSLYVKGPKGLILCESVSNSGRIDEAKAKLEICKTITPISD